MGSRWRRRAALAALCPLAVLLPACGGGAGVGTATALSTSPPQAEGQAAGEGSRSITINNFKYEPATLTVAPGTVVVWTNRDDMPHTVTSPGDPKDLDSPAMDTDERFSFHFREKGSYDYYCTIHPKMAGRVVVE